MMLGGKALSGNIACNCERKFSGRKEFQHVLSSILCSVLQLGNIPAKAHYFNIKGVFRTDFPDRPPVPFNYTGVPLTANLGTSLGTRLSKVAFNSTIELVLQDTNLLAVESRPFHLHGFNFFVGNGSGNFDPSKDPAKFNLVDPPDGQLLDSELIIQVFGLALSPGTAYYVGSKDGLCCRERKVIKESIIPPPKDLPPC